MFGYVRPRRDVLEQDAFDAYHAAYCGLCRALGKNYGFRARFLVNYDMTFLYLLRASVTKQAETKKCWCPAKLCGKKSCTMDNDGFSSVAARTVILCYEKLRDNVSDKGFFRSLPSRLLCVFYRRAFRKAARCLPEFADLCARQLALLRVLEAENCPSIDATADAFAKIVSACADDQTDPTLRRPMAQILYHIGRFLYLADALDDLKEDCKNNAYNPLRYRFCVTEGALCVEDLDYLTQLTDGSVNLAGAALELLPSQAYLQLLENVIYLGLPAAFSAVKAGKFQAKENLWQKRKQKTKIQEL